MFDSTLYNTFLYIDIRFSNYVYLALFYFCQSFCKDVNGFFMEFFCIVFLICNF